MSGVVCDRWWLPHSTLIFSWPYFRGPGESQAVCLHTVNSCVFVQLTLFFSDNINSACLLFLYLKKKSLKLLIAAFSLNQQSGGTQIIYFTF